MKKFIIACLILFTGTLIFYVFYKPVQISESELKQAYIKSLNKEATSAKQMFGKLLKNDQAVVLKDFKLNGCYDDICETSIKLQTLMYGIKEEKKYFLVKKENDKFIVIEKK